jgi:CRP/FNR family transcriptional regulator
MPVQEELIEFIKESLPFWNRLAEDEKNEIIDTASLRMYSKGDYLHKGADDCAGILIVKEGQVRSFILSETGKEITLYRLFEGDICIFSASCMKKNITFDVIAEAETDSEVLLIPTASYKRLNNSNIAVADFTNQLISSRFSDVMWIMEQILFMSFDQRLAIFLIEQSAIQESDDIHITHENIAKNMGSAREVVTRMLNYFQDEGIVELHRGGIKIIDRKRLEAMQ